jgi:hypothetical protein
MEELLATFATQLDQHLDTFLVYLVKRHRLNYVQLKNDFKLFQQGKLEVLEGEPLKTAAKINLVMKKDEIKQVVKDADSDAEESLHLNEDSDSLDAPKPVDSDDEEIEVAKPKGKPTNPSGKPSIPRAKPAESDDDSLPSVSDDESSAPPPKAKPAAKGKAAKKPVAKDDSDSEEVPKPKSKGKAKVVEPDSDDDEPAKPKGKVKVEDTPGELSAMPKMTDGPKVPKDVKFVKGTNLAVVDGLVVAAYTKKGFVPLNKSHDKQIEKTGLESDAWDKDKVAKKLNK